jgi:MFS family permease
MISPSSRAWLAVALLWPVALLNYLDRMMLTTMRESVVSAIPMTEAQFGLLTSAFLWTYGALSPFAGFVADRFNRAYVIIGSLLVWSLITWLTGHARSFEEMLCARALMGISEAFYLPAALALISDYHRSKTRSLATGIHMSGIFIGSAIGGIGGWVAELKGWSHAFHVFGIIGIVYSFVLMLSLHAAPREKPAEESDGKTLFAHAFKSLFSLRDYYLILAFWSLLGICGWTLGAWLPTYLAEQFHLSQSKAGISATGYLQSACLLGVIVSGHLADRWSNRGERNRVMVPVIGVALAAPGVFLAANTNLLPVAIIGLVIYGLARASADTNMMPILCQIVDPRYRATAYGILNMFACLSGGIAVFLGGSMRDAELDLSLLFSVAASCLLLCSAILYCIKPSQSSSTPSL